MAHRPNIPDAVPKASSDPLPEISAFLTPFAPLFRRSQSRHSLERYITGLLTDLDRKNCDTIAAALAGTSTERLQHLLTDADWDSRQLDGARVRSLSARSPKGGVLVLDDITTSGATLAAVRRILRRDAGADAVVGLAAARTTREDADEPRIARRQGWGVLFDLDATLVDSLKLKALRDARRWEEVHASFHLSHSLPDTAAMLAQVRKLAATGVVTMAPRRYAEALLLHHGLEIPVLVGYEDVRWRKPHPEPILRAAEALRVAPNRTIYVGDEIRDMVAAHRAGSLAISFGADLSGRAEAGTAAAHASDWPEVVRAVRRIVQG
jgi:HAD superfamily hydrolase (TIGR01549 family)